MSIKARDITAYHRKCAEVLRAAAVHAPSDDEAAACAWGAERHEQAISAADRSWLYGEMVELAQSAEKITTGLKRAINALADFRLAGGAATAELSTSALGQLSDDHFIIFG
jgi:hypothetical protein